MQGSGFTAVVCASPECGRDDPGTVAAHLFAALREAVRHSPLGVLVSTGCLLGQAACSLRVRAPLVLVQPCDADRKPVAAAVLAGPLRTAADVEALVSWLRAGDLDPGLLPADLLGIHRRMAAARRN